MRKFCVAVALSALVCGQARAQSEEPAASEPAPLTPTIQPSTSETSTVTTTIDHSEGHDTHKGIERGIWYFGLGAGMGASSLSEKSFGGSPMAGMTSLRMGAIIADRLLIGGQFSLTGQFYKWAPSEPTGAALSSLIGEVMYFPMADLPFNVAAGLGWGSGLKVGRVADNDKGKLQVVTDSGNGVAWMSAVGWDFFAGRGLNLGVQARYDGTNSSGLGTSHAGTLNVWMNFY